MRCITTRKDSVCIIENAQLMGREQLNNRYKYQTYKLNRRALLAAATACKDFVFSSYNEKRKTEPFPKAQASFVSSQQTTVTNYTEKEKTEPLPKTQASFPVLAEICRRLHGKKQDCIVPKDPSLISFQINAQRRKPPFVIY